MKKIYKRNKIAIIIKRDAQIKKFITIRNDRIFKSSTKEKFQSFYYNKTIFIQ